MRPKAKAVVLGLILAGAAVLFLPSLLVELNARGRIYQNLAATPFNHVGLLLGTASKTVGGKENLYFKYRVAAALKLYRAGKIKVILVSGDNSSRYYNETQALYQALIKNGVAHADIVMDFAGFRTLDSVVRARKVFGVSKLTIISQPFHNKRALYLARFNGMDAVAYNAQQPPAGYSFKTTVRELLARVKLFYDLLLKVEPRFLGEQIPIPPAS